MSKMDIQVLLDLLEGDHELLRSLCELGVLGDGMQQFCPEDVETVLVTRTLVRELEINWAGVDVILRMRRQLLEARIELAKLSDRLNE